MNVKRYYFEFCQSVECENGHYVLHSDYASLLTRHNALVEAVAWERECIYAWEYVPTMNLHAIDEQVASMNEARAEVDRLISEPAE